MGEWKTVRIEEIAQKIAMGPFGSNIKVETFVSSGVPIISGQHLHASRLDERVSYNLIRMEHAEKLSNSNVFPGDIIFTHAGTIGQVALIPKSAAYDRYVISQRQFYLRVDKSKADPAFVTRWFHSPVGQHRLLMHASQVGVPSISRPVSNLKTIKIDLPTLDEQKAISSVFDTFDDKIDLNRRMNETLEAMARAIFKDWFIEFGPSRAKAEGRPPYLSPEIWDLFPSALDDKDKPEGWDVCRLEDFIGLAYGKSLPAKKRKPGHVAVYGSGGIVGTHDAALVEGPVIIVGRKGSVGSLYWEDGPAFPIDTVFYGVPRIASMLFSYHLLASQPLRDMNTDAAVPGLNRSNVYRLEFPRPPSKLISTFDDVAKPLWKRRAVNLKETKTIFSVRDLLLPKLMSGEIRLQEAEKSMEAVA